MSDITSDLLQIKIEKAKRELSLETVNAISAVDWKTAILGMRNKHGYTFEQLSDLELETELALCGLVSPEDYPKELQKRMKISGSAVNELVKEMNNSVFKKIREELIKNIERKKVLVKNKESDEIKKEIFTSPRINIIPDAPITPQIQIIQPEKLELTSKEKPIENTVKKIETPEPIQPLDLSKKSETAHSIVMQKLSGSLQIPIAKTEHSLENLTKATPSSYPSKADPYRLSPDE